MLESHDIETHEETVQEKTWDFDDTYLTVEVQLNVCCWEDGFKKGDKVRVVVTKC